MPYPLRLTGPLQLDTLAQKWTARWRQRGLPLPPVSPSLADAAKEVLPVEDLWRAAKFVLMHLENWEPQPLDPSNTSLTVVDRWILHRLDALITISRDRDALLRVLSEFIAADLCAWYIPFSKLVLYEMHDYLPEPAVLEDGRTVVAHVLRVTLHLLFPFAPFMAEEIWSHLPWRDGVQRSLQTAPMPQPLRCGSPRDARAVALAVEVIRALDDLRARLELGPLDSLGALVVVYQSSEQASLFEMVAPFILERGRPRELRCVASQVHDPRADFDRRAHRTCERIQLDALGLELLVEVDDADATQREVARVRRELNQINGALVHVERRLDNPAFRDRAPAAVVQQEQARFEMLSSQRTQLEARLSALSWPE